MTRYVSGACISETGEITGRAGDQNGKEVCVHTLASSGHWSRILRPPRNAAKMVSAAYAMAANDHIGYNQHKRTTFYMQAKAKNWDVAKITTDCDTDCSAGMAVVSCCGGVMVSKDMHTGNEKAVLKAAGYADLPYSESSLKPGDILWRSGHTVMYVGTSKTAPKASTPAKVEKKVLAKLVDISHHNNDRGTLDWSKVKSGGYHAIIKCGDNKLTNIIDPKFKWNASECARLGIPFGVFWYARAKTAAQARTEAQRCLSFVKGMKLSYPIYYDIEETSIGSTAVTCTRAFCDEIEKAGYWAGVYTYISYWNQYMRSLGNRFTKWIASYGANDGKAHTAPAIDRLDIWQYSSKGRVDGITGDVDMNYVYRDLPKAITGKSAQAASGGSTATKTAIKYRVRLYGSKTWQAEKSGSTGYAGKLGQAIGYIAISGVKRYRVKTAKGWLPWVTGYNINDLNSGCAGDGSPIVAVQVDDSSCRYAVHVIGGGWLPDMVGNRDTGGSKDTFAGNGQKVDGFRARRV